MSLRALLLADATVYRFDDIFLLQYSPGNEDSQVLFAYSTVVAFFSA